jgi:hypothetical protein
MAWSFWADRTGKSCAITKGVAQLQQEAAIILAQGGGFQAYFNQKRDGSVPLWLMRLMAETARFCRARQAVCHRAQAVPQIALLYSGKAFYRHTARLFGSWDTPEILPLKGVMQSLLDAQQAVEIVMEHHLRDRMADYPLIVVPEWEYLDPAFADELRAYVCGGGNLLLIGPQAAALFAEELRVQFVGEAETARKWLAHAGWLGGLMTRAREVKLLPGAIPFGALYAQNDFVGPAQVAGSVAALGKGKIAAVYFDYGETYAQGAMHRVRDYIAALVRELFPTPLVEVEGSHLVDVTVNRLGGKLMVNLVNTAGPHADAGVHAFEEIPPVGPLQITIRCGSKPNMVTLGPEGTALATTWEQGALTLTLPRLEIHSIIVVE